MGNTSENVQINLKLNGLNHFERLRDLNSEVIAQRRSLDKMKLTDPGYNEAASRLNNLVDAQRAWKNEIQNGDKANKSFFQNFKSGFANIKQIASGVALGSLLASGIQSVATFIGSIPGKIKEAYGEAQKFRAILTNAFKGDGVMANNALTMLQDFAAKTPFQLNEITDSYIKLVNRGVAPSTKALTNMGDVAATLGKPMKELNEAILDVNNTERWNEVGIKVKTEGDKIIGTFKGMTVEAARTEAGALSMIEQFGEMEGVKGTMAAVSATIVGISSNIEDSWSQIFTKIGQKSEGFIYGFYKSYADALDFVNQRVLGTKTKADELTESWIAQGEKLQSLERNTVPLLDRYDQLKSKASLNKTEQTELKDIIAKVSETIPSAITQFDKYGNAMDINSGKARKYIEMQKAMFIIQNESAAKEQESELASLKRQKDYADKVLRSALKGGKQVIGEFETGFSDKEIVNMQKKVDVLQKEIDLRTSALEGLKGGQFDEVKKLMETDAPVVDPVNPTGGNKTDKTNKEATYLQNLLDKMDDAYKTSTAKRLEGFDAEYAAIINKYDKERREAGQHINDTKKLSDALVAIQKAEDAELKTLKEKETKAFNEDQDKQYAEAQKIYEQFLKDEAAAKAKVLEGGLSERELEFYAIDKHYQDLVDLADKYGLDTTAIFEKWEKAQADMADKYREDDQKKAIEKRKEINEAMIDAAYQVASDVFTIMSNSRAAQTESAISEINRQREAELENKNLTDKQKDAINLKYDEKVRAEKRKAWQAEQRAAIVQAMINGALAMTKVSAQTGVLTFAFSPIIAALTAAQIGVIAAQKAPQFKKGGMIPNGPSHENGGINLVNNKTGETVGEMEGGEPIMILSKETRQNNGKLINELLYNSQFRNGAPVNLDTTAAMGGIKHFREGGVLAKQSYTSTSTGSSDVAMLSEMVASLARDIRAVDEKQVVLNQNYFNEEQERMVQVRADQGGA